MYTNGEIIIERKDLVIEIITEKFTITYATRTKSEAIESFMKLIVAHEKIND